jgi:hypothetical protein
MARMSSRPKIETRPEFNFDVDVAKFTDRQLSAVQALDSGLYKYLLYGGALGGGKSYFLRWMAVRLLVNYATKYSLEYVQVMLACEDYPSLKDRQIVKMAREFPAWLGSMYVDHREYGRCFILNKAYGSGVICLRNLDDPSKYQSSEFAAILVDEFTKNDLNTFTDLRMRMRWPGIPDMDCVFLGATNPGGIGHCVPYGDILTQDGWLPIQGIKRGDTVYTVTHDGKLTTANVAQVHSQFYQGELVNVNARGLSIACTPNHSIAKRGGVRLGKNTRDRFSDWMSLVPFEELPGQTTVVRAVKEWLGNDIDSFTPVPYLQRKAKKPQPVTISGDDYIELLGWMLSEGFGNNGETSKKTKVWGISQSKEEQRQKIKTLLDRCGFSYSVNPKSFVLYGNTWWNWAVNLGKCREKRIPKEVRNISRRQLQILLESLVDGDGHWSIRGESGQYYTISKDLADDVAEICLKLGMCVYVSSRQREDRDGASYCVNFKVVSSYGTEILTGHHTYTGCDGKSPKRKSDITYTPYEGKVYCIGVPDTHSFIIRQNGSVWVSGNSFVKALWMDKIFPEEFLKPTDFSKTFVYIPSKAEDNPYLDDAYWAQLQTLPPHLRAAFRDGSWDLFKGQAFQEWSRAYHVVEDMKFIHKDGKQRLYPEGAPLFMTYDWGFGAPFSIGWWWIDSDGRKYRFSEWYGWGGSPNTGMRISDTEVAAGIIKREQIMGLNDVEERLGMKIYNPGIKRLCDPTCFNKKPDYRGGGQMPSTAEVFMNAGLQMQPGDPSRVLKWRQFHEHLKVPRDADGVVNGIPMLQVYASCNHFIRTIPSLIVDDNNIEDIDSSGEDHCADECAHIMVERPIRAISSLAEVKKQPSINDIVKLEREQIWEDVKKAEEMEDALYDY